MNALTLQFTRLRTTLSALALVLCVCAGATGSVEALSPPPQNPQSGSVGLEGTISSPPPSRGAVITNPTNGRSFSTLPVTVSGTCPDNTLVKLFSNNIFIGSVDCKSASFTLQVDLFNGQNDLIARVYDSLDQAGPDSNTVTVTFNDGQLVAFGARVTLTSNFARMGADPKQNLSWPIILSGGSGPYAISVDWGDGKPQTLKSLTFAGPFNVDHIYDSAGVYRVVVKATDANGVSAYLQLVAVANGTITTGGNASSTTKQKVVTVTKTQILLWPSMVAIPLILLTFWIGRRYELLSIRKRIENSTSGDY
jgi:hypothetical protein